jgi:hypothetical protein
LATSSTTAEIYTNSKDIPTGSLVLDIDGDGHTDTGLAPIDNGTAVFIASTTVETQSDNSDSNNDEKNTTDTPPDTLPNIVENAHTAIGNGMPQAFGSMGVVVVGNNQNPTTVETGTTSKSENIETTPAVVLPATPVIYTDATTTDIFAPTSTQAVVGSDDSSHLPANILSSNITSFLSVDSAPKLALWLFVLFVLFAILYIVH